MVTSLRSKWAAGQGGGGEASGFAPLGEKQSEDASPTLLSRRADFRRQRYLRKSLADNLPPEFGNHGSGKERNILQSFVCRSVAPIEVNQIQRHSVYHLVISYRRKRVISTNLQRSQECVVDPTSNRYFSD
jgi:hypothetical protein